MAGTGKRQRHRDNEYEGKNQKRRPENQEKPGDKELVVYRILCPDGAMGNVIGKGGKAINSLRRETQAKIKIVDPFPGSDKRVITIYCYVKNKDISNVDEYGHKPLCPAQNALLKMHDAIVDALEVVGDTGKKDKEEALILVPASQAASIIGKSGIAIKRLRSQTKANIKIDSKEPMNVAHSCAMNFDNFVSITGNAESVRRALYAVSAIMYKFSPEEQISLDTTVPELAPKMIIPSDIPVYPAAGFYTGSDPIVVPGGSVIAPASLVSELHGFPGSSGGWPVYPSSVPVISGYSGAKKSEELIIKILCPSDRIGRVIGKGGGTIKSLRQASGALIDVDDTKDENEECIITVTSTESMDDMKSAGVEAVIALQEKISDENDEKVSIRLMVAARIIGCIIGRGGSIVNDMRKNTKTDIRISKGRRPRNAALSDELVEVFGDAVNLRTALLQIILRLREGLFKDSENDYNAARPADSILPASHSMSRQIHNATQISALDYDKQVDTERGRVDSERGRSAFSSGSMYGYSSLQDGGSRYGAFLSDYGSVSSYSSKGFSGLPSYIEVVIPANSMAIVLGKGGSNLENLRKLSGAHIKIVESKHSRSERIAQISGTSEQKHMAENLIQAFIMAS